MVDQRILASQCFSVPLCLCASVFVLLALTNSNAAEPSAWKLWPFRSVQKSADAGASANSQELAPVVRRQAAPVQVAPASFQSPLASPAPANVEPFPLLPGFTGANDLYRQTDDDVLRKSWGCVNCHQGVRDMHDRETVKPGCCDCHGG